MAKNEIVFNDITVRVEGKIILYKKGSDTLNLSPADVPKATALLGIAGRLQGTKVLMPQIEDDSFIVKFNKDGTLTLTSSNTAIGELPVTCQGLDETVDILNAGAQLYHSTAPPATGRATDKFVPYEGLDL